MIGLVILPLLPKCNKCPNKDGCTTEDRIQRQIEAFKKAAVSGSPLVEICI